MSAVGEISEKTASVETTNPEYKTEHPRMQQEDDAESKTELPADMYYKYEELHSRPFITPESEIPENLLHLFHSFGYDSRRRVNLKLLDDRTLFFIAGNFLILLDIQTTEQRYLRSCSGGGIGAITVHPSREYFAVAEKGNKPNIIIYEYPTLRPYRILRGGTECEYGFVNFNYDGSLLVSLSSDIEPMLTLWNWRQEKLMQRCKAISQEVYRVSFSPYDPERLTSSGVGHIKFWKMTSTFTGLKLQGLMGHFGKIATTDIEGYVELPDGKVMSGTEWGNLLLWEGNSIQMEICRKEGRNCHAGTVQPFALEEGKLMTIGADGFVRVWDFERIDLTNTNDDSNRFEMEPSNEMLVGNNVCLSSVVRNSQSDSFIWFAQDSNGAIWKLDLSFTNIASDPECLFSFHSELIQGLDVSKDSHLMATTSLDRSVRVFDILSKSELIMTRFNQGGTALSWAPSSVNQSGDLLVTGFEDGVVRLLALYNHQRLNAKLRLQQAFKPHNAPVTAVAYDRNGEVLATGSSDCTVFFFTVGEKYSPIGFIHVPGSVQALEWSPQSHSENRLLVLCQSGHVVEVPSPDPEAEVPTHTFQLQDLPRRSFRFKSIKSQIKREQELTRRQAVKEKKREEREKLKEELEEEEEELPPLCIPDPPSPICCGFYSQPGQFWLSMGGLDAGFLYHCKFSEDQDEDPKQRQDKPFDFLLIADADNDPVCSVTFSSNRQLLLCGMSSGSIRLYPLQPGDHSLSSMQAFWALSIHDNQYGHLRHIRFSHDDLFVLTAGDDGNIFSFCLVPPEELEKNLQRKESKVPSPTVGLENEMLALDITDSAASSIETIRQNLVKEKLQRVADMKLLNTQKQIAELQKKFKRVLINNHKLPEHVRLKPEELHMDLFCEQVEKLKVQKVMEVRKQLAWEQEHCSIALRQIQKWVDDSLGAEVVTVFAIYSNRRISTYRLSSLVESLSQVPSQNKPNLPDGGAEAVQDHKKFKAEPVKVLHQTVVKDLSEPALTPSTPPPEKEEALCQPRVQLEDHLEKKRQKAAERAEQAWAKIEKRKQEWAQIYAEKPDQDYEDPELGQAILEASESISRVKKSTLNPEEKKRGLISLELKIREKQTEMNRKIIALRDSKVQLVSRFTAQTQQLQEIQQCLSPHLHLPPPTLPTILPEETPEKKLQCSRAILEKYWKLREQRLKNKEQEEGTVSLLEHLENEMMAEEQNEKQKNEEENTSLVSVSREDKRVKQEEWSKMEKALQKEEQIRLLHKQKCLLQQMESSVNQFDAELHQLYHQKLRLDCQLKLVDLRLPTIHQEMLVLKQFESREGGLQEKLNKCIQEEKTAALKLEECNELLELKEGEITKLQERLKALTAAFQASLGEKNPFKEFLTQVFKKKIRREKEKEPTCREETETDSEEGLDSDLDGDYYSSAEEEGAAPDVCPKGCNLDLFENTLQLQQGRLDLMELLVKERKIAEALKEDSNTLLEKEKLAKSNLQLVKNDLDLINQEKQQKINELEVTVPLKFNQIEFISNGSVPSDLSEALVLDGTELVRLDKHIEQLTTDIQQQGDLHRQDLQQRSRLMNENKQMTTKVQELEEQCNELMMIKFGRPVDLEALQMLLGSRRLEELEQEKHLLHAAHAKEMKYFDVKLEEAQEALRKETEINSQHLYTMISLLEQRKELEAKLNTSQEKTGRQQVQDFRRRQDQEKIQKLQELINRQNQEAEALRREISLLSSAGGHVLPPHQTPDWPQTPLKTPTRHIPTGRK